MRLKELREEKRLTQVDVANAIKTSQRNIGRWEKGEVLPSSEFVIKLADFFEVTADYLLGRSDDLGNVTVSPTPATLTTEEREIIAMYSALDFMGKKLVRQTLETLSGMERPAKTAKK